VIDDLAEKYRTGERDVMVQAGLSVERRQRAERVYRSRAKRAL